MLMMPNLKKYFSIFLCLIYGLSIYFIFPKIGYGYLILSIIPLIFITWQHSLQYGLLAYLFILTNLFLETLLLNYGFLNMFFNFSIIIGSIVTVTILIAISYLKTIFKRLKLAEDNLKELFLKQEKMISNISDVIAIINEDGIITYKSPSLEPHFGWKPEDLLGKSGFYNVHPDDKEKMESKFELLIKGQIDVVREEFKYCCKDGTYKFVQLTAKNMLHDSQINGILLNYHDITARKKAIDKLIDSEIKYRTLFEKSVDIVCLLNVDGNILDINNAGIDTYEYSREELMKMNVSELIYEEDKKRSKKFFEKLNKEGFYKLYEGRIVTKTGKIKWIQVSSSEILIDGRKIGSQDIIRDITEKKEAIDRLKHLNATKDKFFSIISHDLRNPFISLIGFSELLLANVKSKKYNKVDEFAKIINETAIQSDKLLTNLLQWSELQRGTFTRNFEPLLLIELAKEAFKVYQGNLLQKEIKFKLEISDDISVYADKNMTTTIFRNLISNAIKFTKSGGAIIVDAIVKGESIQVSVIDNGVGISAKDIESIFKIEQSFSTSGTNQEKGTGLGLILCKEFAENQNGNIWVESKLGVGSIFYFSLPKYEAE